MTQQRWPGADSQLGKHPLTRLLTSQPLPQFRCLSMSLIRSVCASLVLPLQGSLVDKWNAKRAEVAEEESLLEDEERQQSFDEMEAAKKVGRFISPHIR